MTPVVANHDFITMDCPSFYRLIFRGHKVLGLSRLSDEGYISAISLRASAFRYDVPYVSFPVLLMMPCCNVMMLYDAMRFMLQISQGVLWMLSVHAQLIHAL